MGSQCQLYITNENPNENRNKYSRIIDKYSSTSYVRQLRVNSLRVQTNSNCYKSQEERGKKKKISINLTSCSFYTCISYFLSFFFPKVNQTNACNVRLFAPDSYCRNVVEWSSKTMKIFRGFHSIDIYISYKYIVVSSANAIVMNLEHSFSILFSG